MPLAFFMKITMTTFRIVLLCLLPVLSVAQRAVSTRLKAGADLGVGFQASRISPSFIYYQLINPTRTGLFSLGYTVAFRTFYANDVDYITAPVSPLVPAKLDTLRMNYASGTSLNLGIRAQINLKFIEIGASADLLGLTIGKGRVGQYISSGGSFVAGQTAKGTDSLSRFVGANINQTARPSLVNFQLPGNSTLGTVANEVYARVYVQQRIGIKLAYQWLASEYTTTVRNTVDDNNRFRSRSGLVYVGITFPFYD